MTDQAPEPLTVTLDDLWNEMWEDLRHNATGQPSGRAIIANWRVVIEGALAATLDAERAARVPEGMSMLPGETQAEAQERWVAERAARAEPGPRETEPSFVEYRTTACHAGSDGDCSWAECPQLRDGEPIKSGRHCPLDAEPRIAWSPATPVSKVIKPRGLGGDTSAAGSGEPPRKGE